MKNKSIPTVPKSFGVRNLAKTTLETKEIETVPKRCSIAHIILIKTPDWLFKRASKHQNEGKLDCYIITLIFLNYSPIIYTRFDKYFFLPP